MVSALLDSGDRDGSPLYFFFVRMLLTAHVFQMYFCVGVERSLSFRCKQEKKSNVIICLVLIGLTSVRASMSKELAFVQGVHFLSGQRGQK